MLSLKVVKLNTTCHIPEISYDSLILFLLLSCPFFLHWYQFNRVLKSKTSRSLVTLHLRATNLHFYSLDQSIQHTDASIKNHTYFFFLHCSTITNLIFLQKRISSSHCYHWAIPSTIYICAVSLFCLIGFS